VKTVSAACAVRYVTPFQDCSAEGLKQAQIHGFATGNGEGLGNPFNMLDTGT